MTGGARFDANAGKTTLRNSWRLFRPSTAGLPGVHHARAPALRLSVSGACPFTFAVGAAICAARRRSHRARTRETSAAVSDASLGEAARWRA